MKEKKFALFLAFEAGVLLLLKKVSDFKAESIFDFLSYPIEKMADFLGFLSLKSSAGNAVAIAIYVSVCLVPVYVLLFKVKRKTFEKTDSLLVLMSAVLFAVVYLLINPYEMSLHGYSDGASAMVTFSFWSLFFGYLILKFTDNLTKTDGGKTEKLLSLVLKIMGAVFVFSLCTMESAVAEIGIMTFLGFLSTAVPHIFSLIAVFLSLDLLNEFTLDRYSENTVKGAERLSSVCIVAVKVSVVVGALFNVLQLRYINELSNINFKLQVPLFSLGFILLVLIMAGFIKDSKVLKEDNDSFI